MNSETPTGAAPRTEREVVFDLDGGGVAKATCVKEVFRCDELCS
jgi:hypothetical protein